MAGRHLDRSVLRLIIPPSSHPRSDEIALGAAIGVNAAFLNIVTEWLSDVKRGYCTTAFYLNESFCCWGAENGQDRDSIGWCAFLHHERC